MLLPLVLWFQKGQIIKAKLQMYLHHKSSKRALQYANLASLNKLSIATLSSDQHLIDYTRFGSELQMYIAPA